jgi:DNA-binding MarR family transcriptional regulator
MPHKQDHIQSLLHSVGADPAVIDAVVRVDDVIQEWRRKMTKRELGHRAIEKLSLPLDLAQLDVLFAISSPGYGADDADSETMVGTVAERLGIDPSRASRMVADMVSSGYARRAVSQIDGRRAIVELTDKGLAITQAVRSYRWLMLADYLAGWPKEDIAIFVPLLERYTEWFSDFADREERLGDEISALVTSVSGSVESDTSGRKAG